MDGYKQIELFKVARETLPNAQALWALGTGALGGRARSYRQLHEGRVRLVERGEGGGRARMLSNDNNSDFAAMMDRYHDIPAPHGYGPGIVGRMVGIGMDCVAFEMSRGDFDRHKKVVRQ